MFYENHKQVDKSKEEWIKVENTYPPIIDMDTWELTQEIDKMHSHPRYNSLNEISLFGVLLYYMDCGFALRHNTERHKRKNGPVAFYESYTCGNYTRSGCTACSTHRIYLKPLLEVVLDDIRKKAEISECSEAEKVRRMTEYRQSQSAEETVVTKKTVKAIQNDVQEWVNLFRQYRNLESLDREMLLRLIDKIEIGELWIMDGLKELKIQIFLKFVGYIG